MFVSGIRYSPLSGGGDINWSAKASIPSKGESHKRLDFSLKRVVKIKG